MQIAKFGVQASLPLLEAIRFSTCVILSAEDLSRCNLLDATLHSALIRLLVSLVVARKVVWKIVGEIYYGWLSW